MVPGPGVTAEMGAARVTVAIAIGEVSAPGA